MRNEIEVRKRLKTILGSNNKRYSFERNGTNTEFLASPIGKDLRDRIKSDEILRLWKLFRTA